LEDVLKALERKGLSTKGKEDKIPSLLARRVKNGTLIKEGDDDRKFYWAEPARAIQMNMQKKMKIFETGPKKSSRKSRMK
jgi:hypothetical protein